MNAPKLRFKEFNDEWKTYTVGDITESLKSGLSRLLQHQDIGIPVIRANNIENGKLNYNDLKYWYVNDPQGADTSNYLVHKNDILINFINSEAKMGTAAIVANEPFREMIYTTNILKMNTNSLADNYFFYCYTDSKKYKDYIKLITKPAVNQASFTTVDFKKHKITLPTIKEQIKIASFFEEIDKKIQLQQEKMDLLKEQKKGYMQKIFTQELRFKDENNIEFPEWNSKSIKSIAEIIGGGTPNTQDPSLWNGNIPWISSSDILQDNYYDINISRYITESAIKNSATHLIPSNSIAIVSRVGLGKVAYITKEYCTSQDFQNLINFKENPIFLIHAIALELKRIIAMSQGTSIKGITKKELENIHIYLPCIEEQNKIGDFLKAFDIKILNEEEKIELLKSKKKYFMQQMFI